MKCTPAAHPAVLAHTKAWQDCTRCPLCEVRKNVVFWEGRLPAPVLFLGKAPNDEANMYGVPFPREGIFHDLAAMAPRWAVTYLVGCGPPPVPLVKKDFAPCWPKVVELTTICRPKLIVLMGNDVFSFVISHLGDIVKSLGYRPAIISVADPFWISTSKDPDQHTQNARLVIESAVAKYICPSA